VSTGLAAIGLAVPFGTALASVARSLIRHRTERQRLELVERLAARHGVDAVSTLSKLIPPELPHEPRFAHPSRQQPTK
jgi:hypothetical protein